MGLVYASDIKHDGEFVKKRGEKFVGSDAKKFFDLDDATSLVDDGVIVMDSALPENDDSPRATSYYELEAEMLRNNDENDESPSEKGLASEQPKAVVATQGKGQDK